LWRNAANIHFEGQSSQLRDPATDDKYRLKIWDFGDLYYIYVCINKEQHSDQVESK
jgi:hypothetical protein